MINVAHARAALDAMTGDAVVTAKAQMAEMLTEIELGQRARRALTNIRSITTVLAIAANDTELPA